MTPDLMKAGAQTRVERERRAVPEVLSGGRQASYGRRHEPGSLDLSHGVILYLDDITVSFDGFKALNALNLTIGTGELRCIIGPNGAGKSALGHNTSANPAKTASAPFNMCPLNPKYSPKAPWQRLRK